MKKLASVAPKAHALSKFNKIFGEIVNPLDGIENLNFLEKYGETYLVCLRGYSQSKDYPSSYNVYSSLVEIFNWILISRLIILTLTSSSTVSFYTGDIFYGTTTRFHMNAVFAIGSITLGVVRSFIYWMEHFNLFRWLNYFSIIQKHGFRTDMLHVSQKKLRILRTRLYMGRQFFTFFTPITVVVTSFIFTYSVINNPIAYSSATRLVLIILWNGATVLAAVGAIVAAIWLFVHIYLLIVYLILRLDHVDLLAFGMIKLPVIPVNLIRSLVNEQTSLFNAIDIINDQIRNFFFFGYNFAAFAADFLLYMAITMPKDNFFNNILVFGLGVEVTFMVCLIVYLSGTIHIRTHQTYHTYHLIIEKSINTRAADNYPNYKVLGLLERIGGPVIGLYIGDTFPLTYYQFVTFLLENASLMLLLAGTMARIIE